VQPRELSLRFAWWALQQTYAQWSTHGATRLAAALAFYTMFSLAPLLVVAIAVAGIFLGRDAVRGELMAQMAGLVGRDGASAIEDLIAHAGVADGTLTATVVGFAVLLFGASNVVGELKASFKHHLERAGRRGGLGPGPPPRAPRVLRPRLGDRVRPAGLPGDQRGAGGGQPLSAR
jgi:uncharacterized BrkB/YihY/UPF0761 family membrane protein